MPINGSWSGMRRYLEDDMLCDSLKGRIRYDATTYVGMDGDCVFSVFVDSKRMVSFSMEHMAGQIRRTAEDKSKEMFWKNFWKVKNIPITEREVFDDQEFTDALEIYRQSDIKSSLESDNQIVRMFAILDRRVGKRTLEKLAGGVNNQPEWLKFFYTLRLEAENIAI